MGRLRWLVDGRPLNALLSWTLIGVLAVVAATDIVTGRWLWAGFSVTVIAVALIPAVATGERSEIVAWEALLLATLPLAAQLVDRFADPMTYVSVATLALLVAVQLVRFSETEMPPWFAVIFVVMATMAIAAVWAVVQYHADAFLGTSFVPGRKELMWDLVGATAGGLVAGVIFELYFERRSTTRRVSTETKTG